MDSRKTRVRAVLAFLGEHPLVWLIPVLFFTLLFAFTAWRISTTPVTPFDYRL